MGVSQGGASQVLASYSAPMAPVPSCLLVLIKQHCVRWLVLASLLPRGTLCICPGVSKTH